MHLRAHIPPRENMSYLHDQPYVLSSFLQGYAKLLVHQGGNLEAVLRRSEMTLADVTGPHRLLPFDRFIALLEAGAAGTGDTDFALHLAARQNLRIVGPLVGMLRNVNNAGEALQLLAQQLSLLVWGLHLSVQLESGRVSISYRVTLPTLVSRKQFQDYLLGSTANIVRLLMGPSRPPRCVRFSRVPTPGEPLGTYDKLFRGPVEFNAAQPTLIYDAEILEAPLLPLPEQTDQHKLKREAASLEKQVIDTLAIAMPSGKINLPEVAAELACSERTLRRHLASHELSFAQLRDTLRFRMANDYLSSTCYSLGNIADLLGFANQSAFTRSYLRWSGQTPSAFRARLQWGD